MKRKRTKKELPDTAQANERALFARLISEQRNTNSMTIDKLSTPEILHVINREDQSIAIAVEREIPYISQAVDLIVTALSRGGRLIYAGAGTSGRLGILDATECPPTYGTDPEIVQGIIAGGKKAVFRSVEGAEDKTATAIQAIRKKNITSRDVVCGIAASMRTPYVISAICEAKRKGANTIYVTTNPRSLLDTPEFALLKKNLDVAICPEVGPEVVMGSTRMKAGTAQKMTLNMLTTASMIKLGKVYENMMVDLKLTNKKLEERAKRIIMIATGAEYATAEKTLHDAGDHVKTAIVMIKKQLSASKARQLLKQSGGFVRTALEKK